jgi:hypothetical protein
LSASPLLIRWLAKVPASAPAAAPTAAVVKCRRE